MIAVRKVKKVDNEEVIETIHAYEFIKKLIIHIPEKNFKMIRYFGIYFLLVDI
ncbi:transposase [uncultured Clostridium sp.]|uniref:transposase n=1 Tax=uncultured Clostridium sp. TaxID=59620 RepID=UPI0025E64956|nr:transposase [uncultured Clostridium sp.]